jgi:signal transduction histidine kinase
MIGELWVRTRIFLNRVIFSRKGKRLERYGIPLLLVVLAIIVKFFAEEYFFQGSPFLLLTLIVIFSSWYGGFGPGIVTTILLAFLNDYFFLTPRFTLVGSEHFIQTILFIFEGILISIINEARKQAEDLKDEFIGFAGHELKNPLTSVKAYTELIKKNAIKKNDIVALDYSTKIDSYVNKLVELVNDLLDITKIEAGRLTFNDSTFLFNELVKDIVSEQTRLTRTHRIILKGTTQKTIVADKYRIGQVIINLITNAIKYSPSANKVLITISQTSDGVLLRIKDFGIGIPKEFHQKIFSRFFRLGNKKNSAEGLGIGLYISSQIVKHYNGKLWVTSRGKSGSTFHLFLPTSNN